LHEGSLPNSWSTTVDSHEYSILAQQKIREDFNFKDYYLDEWQDVFFQSRDSEIKINGWLFNYFPNRPIVIVTHGISPNGKCKSEANLIAGLLVNKNFNVLTIDLRNYGQSDTVSSYDDLGLESYNDILGAFDFLKKIGFKSNSIGLHGISLGASTSIFAADAEPEILAIWADSPLAEFNMILKDEIARYGLSIEFGPAVSLAGRILTGIDPRELSPAKKLSDKQSYFFTHGDSDTRILTRHFNYFKEYTNKKNINAEFWLVEGANHLDSMLIYPEDYSTKMEEFFNKNLK
jgi:dipeptidyl aminopeptidase/acylaminoacyl peptidase